MTVTEFYQALNPALLATILSIGTTSFLAGYLVGKKIAVLRRVINSSV